MILKFPRKKRIMESGDALSRNKYTQKGQRVITVGSLAQSLTSGSTHSASMEMSILLTNAVWHLEIPSHEKIVMLALADHAKDDGACWPGVPLIAKKCSLSVRQIQRILKSLETKGFLKRDFRWARSTKYQLMVTLTAFDGDVDVTHNCKEPPDDEKCFLSASHKWHPGCTVLPPPYWVGVGKSKKKNNPKIVIDSLYKTF